MQSDLTLDQQATNYQTMRHIERVRNLLNLFVGELLTRAEQHDQSKLDSPEVELFTEFTPKLAACTYGSPEYDGFRKAMGSALAHHYANNRHHPEHHKDCWGEETTRLRLDITALDMCEGLAREVRDRLKVRLERDLLATASSLNNMTLVDILEMIVDWKAASERHNDGNILKSIEVNCERFGLSAQLVRILESTAKVHFQV